VPAVPAVLVTSAADAEAAAASFDGAVAMKLCSAEVAHKTELGGVELGVGADGVAAAYDRLVGRAEDAGVGLEGILVSPMRSGGTELLVGVVPDDDWGQVLAVGVGGQLVEILDDSALRVLPVGRADVHDMLRELQGFRLLTGFRGRTPADLESVVDAVLAIANLAQGLGPAISALEVNPLLVDGARVEALDVLITPA
jgi:succinyl-CoA synthetase beta subunit